jgi:ABC-type sugar transport system substrate-binding protein
VKSFLPRGRKAACIAAAGAIFATTVVTALPAQAADKDTIAFSPIALAIPALKGLSEGVKAVGAAKGYNTLILDPNFDAIKQAQQLNAVITSGKIDAGWVISIKPPAIIRTALLAQKKKVPLVLNGVPRDYGFTGPQRGLSFARIDYNKVGAAMGVTAGQCVNQKLGGKAEVIFLTSRAGTAGREEQDAAAKKWLATTAPGTTIVQTIEVVDRAGAQKDVAAALQAHPNVKVVTGGNDEGSLGAISAFEGAGKALPCVTENGGNDEVLAAVKSGKIFASAALQFEADLIQTFNELGRLLKNPTAFGKLMSVPVKVIQS